MHNSVLCKLGHTRSQTSFLVFKFEKDNGEVILKKNKTNTMGQVILHMSMSLDGFIAGLNDSVEKPLGEGGEKLHNWMNSGNDADVEIMKEWEQNIGAVVMGRWSFEIGVVAWGANPPFHSPVFVVSHKARERIIKDGGTTYTFVTNGMEHVLTQAKKAAGNKQVLLHGANIFKQYLKAELVDEIYIHLVPVLLGNGKRLFHNLEINQIDLIITKVIATSSATHIKYKIVK